MFGRYGYARSTTQHRGKVVSPSLIAVIITAGTTAIAGTLGLLVGGLTGLDNNQRGERAENNSTGNSD